MPSSSFSAIHNTHAAYGVKLYLEVNKKSIPVVDATVEFVLNQIPIAKVNIPSGAVINNPAASVNATPNSQILTPDDLMGKKEATLRLVGEGKPHPSNSNATPKGSMNETIFEGYVLSYTADFSTTGVATTVVLTHWMYDLDSSSFSSGSFDKTAPDSWFSYSVKGVADDPSYFVTRTGDGPGGAVTALDFADNDWWDIIQKAAIFKAKQPLDRFTRSTTPSNTNAAVKALGKLQSGGKLRLNAKAAAALKNSDTLPLKQINSMIGRTILTGEGGATAFEKLIYIFSQFGCVLAPRVDTVLIHAYNPVGRIEKTIPDSECDFGGGSANPALFPVGAIMYGGGLTIEVENNSELPKVEESWLGFYSPKALQKGVVDAGPYIVFPTPKYLSKLSHSQVPLGTFDPKVGIVPVSAPTTKTTSTKQVLLPRDFADEVAKSYYFASALANKTQDVICGFRLDIAPGDCIKVTQSANSVSGRNVSGLAKNWHKRGVVESVTHTLSSSSKRINTIIRLRHVLESQDEQIFGITDSGEPAALFMDKPSLPLKVV